MDTLKDKSNIEKELLIYIYQQRQMVQQIQFLIDKHAHKEEFEICAEYNRMKHVQELNINRLVRISKGLPAFEDTIQVKIIDHEN